MLRCQLTSLLYFRPQCELRVFVPFDLSDTKIVEVINDFIPRIVTLVAVPLEREQMWRRSIARNIAAKNDVDSDLIWFTDCDYLFGEGCLDAALDQWKIIKKPEMMFPRSYKSNHNKSIVDEFITIIKDFREPILPPLHEFEHTDNRRAIGGLQIVSGEYVRNKGYLNREKWQTPPDVPFPEFYDDVVFRDDIINAKRRIESILFLPNLYRMRHTEIGYIIK